MPELGQDSKDLYFGGFCDANSALHLLPVAGAARTHPALPAAPGLSPVQNQTELGFVGGDVSPALQICWH